MRKHLRQLLPYLDDTVRDGAFKLAPGSARLRFALRANEAHHGLGLRQIDAAVFKRAARKFSRRCRARTRKQHGFQHHARHGRTAVAIQLCHILARVALRRAHEHCHALVNDLLSTQNFAKRQAMAFPRSRRAAAAAERPV